MTNRVLALTIIGILALAGFFVTVLVRKPAVPKVEFGETGKPFTGSIWPVFQDTTADTLFQDTTAGTLMFTDDAGDDYVFDLELGTLSRAGITKPVSRSLTGNLIEDLNATAKEITESIDQ